MAGMTGKLAEVTGIIRLLKVFVRDIEISGVAEGGEFLPNHLRIRIIPLLERGGEKAKERAGFGNFRRHKK